MASYNDVWTEMNNLSSQVSNFLTVRDLIRDHNQDDKVMDAAVTLIEHFVEKFDIAFDKAWQITMEAGRELDALRALVNDQENIQDKKYVAQYVQEVEQDMETIRQILDND